jgi:hypothetical protein
VPIPSLAWFASGGAGLKNKGTSDLAHTMLSKEPPSDFSYSSSNSSLLVEYSLSSQACGQYAGYFHQTPIIAPKPHNNAPYMFNKRQLGSHSLHFSSYSPSFAASVFPFPANFSLAGSSSLYAPSVSSSPLKISSSLSPAKAS